LDSSKVRLISYISRSVVEFGYGAGEARATAPIPLKSSAKRLRAYEYRFEWFKNQVLSFSTGYVPTTIVIIYFIDVNRFFR
jgi:hypothetical protein